MTGAAACWLIVTLLLCFGPLSAYGVAYLICQPHPAAGGTSTVQLMCSWWSMWKGRWNVNTGDCVYTAYCKSKAGQL